MDGMNHNTSMDGNTDTITDIIIIGAGLSGIGTACHLARECPDKSVAILERREAIGGTWDLFRYPGIRSDSDMFSFGYAFRPWNELQVLADGPAIRSYVRDTADEYGISDKIEFGLKTTGAHWSTEAGCWTVEAVHEPSGETRQRRCRQLILCTGYYNYDTGYTPDFPGRERFGGQVIHPQHWPEGLDYAGKRVVVIGSGATAVTLVPAMADKAGHITMLQRSPSYIFNVPGYDKLSEVLARVLPDRWVYRFARWRNIVIQRWLYKASRRWPGAMRRMLMSGVRKQVGDAVDMRHFSPSYKPWDERLCAVPDANLFEALKSGQASIVTDHIDSFTETGIQLRSGEHLDADIIITATGLELQMMGGMDISVDGETRSVSAVKTYKAVLVEDAPNFAYIFGYTNAPWTLKADLAARYICRLNQYMDAHGYITFIPRDRDDCTQPDVSVMGDLSSGYIQRAADRIPRQGSRQPWQVRNHYERDRKMLLDEPIDDGELEFLRDADASASTSRRAKAA